MAALVADVKRLGLRSIAVPPLGCGLGGLDWADVRPRINRAFEEVPDVHVFLFEPVGAPAAGEMVKSVRSTAIPEMTPGRVVLVGLINRYGAGLMDPFVTLLEVHKLMYFAQAAGEPLRLRYVKAPYGPYAENLRHVLAKIEGHYLSGNADLGDAPDKNIELVPGAVEDAQALLAGLPETRARFDRVADLVDGFETPYGMELLSTVHWVATREGASQPEAAVKAVHGWNDRKRRFTEPQVQAAFHHLGAKGWLRQPGTDPNV